MKTTVTKASLVVLLVGCHAILPLDAPKTPESDGSLDVGAEADADGPRSDIGGACVFKDPG
jgi:hypothetical protein